MREFLKAVHGFGLRQPVKPDCLYCNFRSKYIFSGLLNGKYPFICFNPDCIDKEDYTPDGMVPTYEHVKAVVDNMEMNQEDMYTHLIHAIGGEIVNVQEMTERCRECPNRSEHLKGFGQEGGATYVCFHGNCGARGGTGD
jgi:hypothetical protein